MAKVDIDLVKMVLTRANLDIRKVSEIIEEIKFESENADDTEKKPVVKKQYVMVVADSEGKLKGQDFMGWVLQIPEDDNPAEAVERVWKGAADFNRSPKGRKIPVKTLGEACEFGSAKIFKERGVWIKTKTPVLVASASNKLPKIQPDDE